MRSCKGFTLIELLIIVAIVGILASIAIPQFAAYRDKAYTKGLIEHGISFDAADNEKAQKARAVAWLDHVSAYGRDHKPGSCKEQRHETAAANEQELKDRVAATMATDEFKQIQRIGEYQDKVIKLEAKIAELEAKLAAVPEQPAPESKLEKSW